ncbi:ThiF family adenylyltransferase [Cellulosilyticum sp. I15G10I2]|uniref:ThiF family adenylyltransferase n=1 Tax=Cellulosilyticum sp. I15G10I2 TaxID=1892843 RepID=UPI000B2F3A81|nr:ThiF family adenylyltransferase [Cellulosilyticum sp. I15G10I2]
MHNFNRYSRQIAFRDIGQTGQEKLLSSTIAIIGIGALGTALANLLCRSGIGHIRLIDRDYVELSNLQRQTLFNEDDVTNNTPKAIAAAEHLKKINSSITIEPIVTDVNAWNIEELIKGCDLVLDGTDNMGIRLIINDACVKNHIPWIYGGAITTTGMSMNILTSEDAPCFLCAFPGAGAHVSHDTCSTVGVLGMIPSIVASYQAVEALKILIGSEDIRRSLLYMDVWSNDTGQIDIKKNLECPACVHREFTFLSQPQTPYTTTLCGRDAIQVIPFGKRNINFESLSKKLSHAGNVKFNKFMLSFSDSTIEINLFSDGRAIIKNAKDENAARSIYSEYIGY